MYEYYPCTDYLEHYGVLGMKWGVRRTPEQLGHKVPKAKDPMSKYKNKKLAEIDKAYAKASKTVSKIAKIYPDDPSVQKEIANLKKSYEIDTKRIEDMTYHDYVESKAKDDAAAKAKRDRRVEKVQKNLLWAGKMSLLGVRAYGILKGVDILVSAGTKAVSWLNSEEGAAVVNGAIQTAQKYVVAGDKAIQTLTGMDISTDKIVNDATASATVYVDELVRSL